MRVVQWASPRMYASSNVMRSKQTAGFQVDEKITASVSLGGKKGSNGRKLCGLARDHQRATAKSTSLITAAATSKLCRVCLYSSCMRAAACTKNPIELSVVKAELRTCVLAENVNKHQLRAGPPQLTTPSMAHLNQQMVPVISW